MKTKTETTARIFLTDYASYNNGTQFKHGHWVDLDQFNDADELGQYIADHFNEVGISDPEPMFTDFEGFPKKFYSESGMDFEALYEYLGILNDCHNPEALALYVDAGYDAEDFEDAYQGEFNSDEDFAQNMAEECGYMDKAPPSWPFNCIDWEWAARELMHDYFEVSGHYFRYI